MAPFAFDDLSTWSVICCVSDSLCKKNVSKLGNLKMDWEVKGYIYKYIFMFSIRPKDKKIKIVRTEIVCHVIILTNQRPTKLLTFCKERHIMIIDIYII